MRAILLAVVSVLATSLLFCGEPMYVAVCNLSALPEATVNNAKTEAAFVFSAAGADIQWIACDAIPQARTQLGGQLFIIRLRNGSPRSSSRSVALDTMGRAYTNEPGSGLLADAYMRPIDASAEQKAMNRDLLLGLVISHELGHLLLGPGHVPSGVMCGTWKAREAQAMHKRWLRFDREQSAAIRRELQKLAEESKRDPADRN
jgi:hypothetical protein